MITSDPSTQNAASLSAVTRGVTGYGNDRHNALHDVSETRQAHGYPAGTRREAAAAGDVSSELGYGCVDWFIYVTDPVAISARTFQAGND